MGFGALPAQEPVFDEAANQRIIAAMNARRAEQAAQRSQLLSRLAAPAGLQ
jgi:hypothetical protein